MDVEEIRAYADRFYRHHAEAAATLARKNERDGLVRPAVEKGRALPKRPGRAGSRRRRVWLMPAVLILAAGSVWLVLKPTPPALDIPWGSPDGQPPETRVGYVLRFNPERKLADWVAYPVWPGDSNYSASRIKDDAYADSQQISRDLLEGTNLDVAAMVTRIHVLGGGEKAVDSAMLATACAPMTESLHKSKFRSLNSKIKKAAEAGLDLWVIKGPVFEGEPRKIDNFDVPSHYFCLILDHNLENPRVIAFLLPNSANSDKDLELFLTSVDEIEAKSGLDFFPKMRADLQKQIESETPDVLWPELRK